MAIYIPKMSSGKPEVLTGRHSWLLLLSNTPFICQKEKGRAEVSKAPSCSPRQYDRNVSWK